MQKRFATLALAVVSTLAASTASARLGVQDFVGTYRLVSTTEGFCYPDLRVWVDRYSPSGETGIRMGSQFFPRVNGGPWEFNDSEERGTAETTLRGNELTHRANYWDKHREAFGSRYFRAHLDPYAGTLWLRAQYSGYTDHAIECTYERFDELPPEV